jgi:hypothetical protein
MVDVVGLVGILLCFAGAHLLWLARHEVLYWMDTYLVLFRQSFEAARREEPAWPEPPSEETLEKHGLQKRPRDRREMWLMLGGFALVAVGMAATWLVIFTLAWRRFVS